MPKGRAWLPLQRPPREVQHLQHTRRAVSAGSASSCGMSGTPGAAGSLPSFHSTPGSMDRTGLATAHQASSASMRVLQPGGSRCSCPWQACTSCCLVVAYEAAVASMLSISTQSPQTPTPLLSAQARRESGSHRRTSVCWRVMALQCLTQLSCIVYTSCLEVAHTRLRNYSTTGKLYIY